MGKKQRQKQQRGVGRKPHHASGKVDVCMTCLRGEEWCFEVGKVGHVSPDYYHSPPQEEVGLAPTTVEMESKQKLQQQPLEDPASLFPWCSWCGEQDHRWQACPEGLPADWCGRCGLCLVKTRGGICEAAGYVRQQGGG
ncbi:UNVERIFIED_CONTAM: hypothetical protein FKN15_070451 [Acipenser sinensis]